MKLNFLETHDRLLHFKKQSDDISECVKNLVEKKPFGEHNFYIFAHVRTDDDGHTKRLIWQPRLTKPKAQTNSMLFKAYLGTDTVKTVWMIPPREMWSQYSKGMMTESKTVYDFIHDFEYNREILEQNDEDDLSDAQIHAIYLSISQQARKAKQESLAAKTS
jgi:hypothetical protein